MKTDYTEIRPVVSIIVPVYNAEKTITRCLDALQKQTYTNIEIICVDDGSKDESWNILQEYAAKDKRFLVFTQKNSGPAKTRHFALSKSSGEYIMFCDADDWYEADMVETMVNTIEKENVDMVMCDSNIIDLANGKIQTAAIQNYHRLKIKNYAALDVNNITGINVVLWNKIFKSSLLKKITYPTQFEFDDTVFFFKYCTLAKTYFGIDRCLYNYVVGNPDSIMGQFYNQNNTKSRFDFILAFQDLYDYLIKQHIEEKYTNFFTNLHFSMIKPIFYRFNSNNRKQTQKILKKFINKNKFLLRNRSFATLSRINRFKDFEKYLITGEYKEISFLEKIFSVKNNNIRKEIRIFGLVFKFKSKNLEQKEEMKKLLNTLYYNINLTKKYQQELEEIKHKLNSIQEQNLVEKEQKCQITTK